jgi:hypothetical protein
LVRHWRASGRERVAEEGYFYQMGAPPLRVGVLMSVPGVEFEDAWERREKVSVAGWDAYFMSREDLIAAKVAAGRPQDLLGAESLRKSNG